MLSEARHTTRSPSGATHAGSEHTRPTSRATEETSRSSSASEAEEPGKIPPAPPLPSSIRVPTKSPSASSSTRSTATNRSTSERPTGNTSAPKTSNQPQKPSSRRENSDKKNNFGVGIPVRAVKLFQPKQTTTGNNDRLGIHDLVNSKSKSTYAPVYPGEKTNKSIFEKVDTHDGHTTYLGAGTFPQLEHCIRDCLSGNRSHHIDITNHVSQHHFPHKNLTRASVLDDYSYEGLSSPKHQVPLSNNTHEHVDHHHHHRSTHHYSDHHDHSNHHYHRANHPKSAAELSLVEIREVNDALAQYGIPVFSHHPNPHNSHHNPHTAGEILSACRLLLEEPRLGVHNKDGTHAVQHVWDALHHYNPPPPPPPPPANHGYASPAVRAVASHLFNPSHQPPYDPVHSVASHLFNSPQPPSHNPVQGVASHLFSGQPQSSFGQAFHQYPGNSHYNY